MRNDGIDISEFQDINGCPVWEEMVGVYSFVAVRVCDGRHLDQSFASLWAGSATIGARWRFAYVLGDPRLAPAEQVSVFSSHFSRSGGVWGPGIGVAIDDESTPFHGQYADAAMREFNSRLRDLSSSEPLMYTHPLQGNYGFCADEGWPSWFPWPIQREVRASDGIIVPDVHQWGVAGWAEQPGFPRATVDVNQINNPQILDRITNLTDIPAPAPPKPPIPEDEELLTLILTEKAQGGVDATYVVDADANCWWITSPDTVGVLYALGKLRDTNPLRVSPQTVYKYLHYRGKYEGGSKGSDWFQQEATCPDLPSTWRG